MSSDSTSDRSWMSVEGYIQPLSNAVGLNKLRENGNKYWFVAENESNLLYYNQRNKDDLPNTQPEGSIGISSGKLEVFVVLTSNDEREYLMFPSRDDCITDWLANLKNKTIFKNKTALEDKSVVPFERGSANQSGFMSRMRNSFRPKKKLARSTSEDPQTASARLKFKRPSYTPSSTDDTISELTSLRESIQFKSLDSQIKRKSKRSQSCPNTEYAIDAPPNQTQPEVVEINKYEDKCCDTSSLVCLDWIITEGSSDNSLEKANKSLNNNLQDDEDLAFPLRKDQSTQTNNMQQAEDALKDALVLLARQIPAGKDSTMLRTGEMPEDEQLEEKPPTDGSAGDNEKADTVNKPKVNYVNGVMTLQQQKLIRELEMEVCKLKCEVIDLIQGTINIPLKDDDLADWHYVEEIRYKDRIFELLREARLYNPSLPNYDSPKSGNQFKDAYGFIHGSRESESVVFHYVCRELTQHYSSFYQDRTGHVKFWTEYSIAKSENDDRMLFQEREIKSLVQEGIPNSCRSQVWKCFILDHENAEGKHKKPNLYSKLVKKSTVMKNKLKSEMTEVERQIRCDLLRTMPSNQDFKTLESQGVIKLSRVLHAFVDYKPRIGYLQGMNFLVGLFLLNMDEEDAFWSLCAVVDIYLKHYFDEILSGAQADQEVLKELIAEQMPALNAHLKYYSVDISTVTFNWFITVFLDAVPFETAIRIWDCFLFKGKEVLFRIAIGLLKLQQRSLLQLSGYLEIMQYMKRAARVTYDIDRLFKVSFDEITKFRTNEELDEMQKKYRPAIEAKNDFRLTVKHERKRSRVSSFTVEIATPDRSDRLDHVQIVECAVAASTDLSQPVCIPCSVRGETKLYLLDINKKERSTLEANIDSRVLCADVVGDGTLLIGTVSWYIYAFSLDFCEEIWSIQLSDSVIDLCHYDHETDDKVYAALADGSIAVLPNAISDGPPSEGSHVRIGLAPVLCVTLVDDKVWCGCSNNVVVLETSSLEEVYATEVSPSARHQVARLIAGVHGVWCTIRGSSWVILMDKYNYDFLLKVDVAFDTSIIDAVSESQITVSPFQESRVTTVLPFGEELWVGLGNGQVLIFDIVDHQESSQESSCDTVKEDSGESRDSAQGNTGDVSSQLIAKLEEQKKSETSEKIISDLRCSIKMRVQYRVSEEAIRSLIVLRETDGPIVLSCAGTLSPEGGLSIWEKEATELDSEEWMPCPIRHMIPHDSRSGQATPMTPTITVSPS